MPRKIGLAAAGRWLLDNIPVPGNGRGGTQERIDFLATLTVSKVLEYLLEGTDPAYKVPNVGGSNLVNSGIVPSLGGNPLGFASDSSIEYDINVNSYDLQQSAFAGAGTYVWELWYQQDDKGSNRRSTGSDTTLLSASNNASQLVGSHYYSSNRRTYNFPMAGNAFNGVLEWESFFDFYGDGKAHQLLEVHDIGNRSNYTVYLDGVPIAEGTNGGQIEKFDGAGMSFNGYTNRPVSSKSGGIFGSFTLYNNGQQLTQNDVRELYENSSLNGNDMLNVPTWIPLDQSNMTFEDVQFTSGYLYNAKHVQAGDIDNATGVVSGAIPRSRKVYFEVSIEDQGDSSNSSRIGVRKMIGNNVTGSQAIDLDSEYLVAGNTAYEAPITSLGNNIDSPDTNFFETGVHLMVAIDWQTGQLWFGKNGTWNDNNVGDPENGLNEVAVIDINTNWCVHASNNSTVGNSKRMLRTKFHEMLGPIPPGFTPWELGTELALEPTVNGPNRRAASLQFMGAIKDREWLMEGGTAALVIRDTGDRLEGDWYTLVGGNEPTYNGDQLSHSSPTSVRWGAVRGMNFANAQYFEDTHAFELIFRNTNNGGAKVCLLGAQSNANIALGKNTAFAPNWPSITNNFNGAVLMESEVDLWGDFVTKYHLMEIHDERHGDSFLTIVNGMPVADETTGALKGMLGVGAGGWEMNANFNVSDAARSQADYGSLTLFRGGNTFNLFKARQLYEASVIGDQDMLTLPRWFKFDGVNVTVGGTGDKDLTLGDVSGDTGCRSGAIPRNGKVYFELFVIAQGDSTFGDLGIRKLTEPSTVGDNISLTQDDALYMQSTNLYDNQGTNPLPYGNSSQHGLLDQSTGRTMMFAIDWDTGETWVGTDGAWNGAAGSYPVGDPATGANPAKVIDTDTNWACWACVVGAVGNQQYRIVSADADLVYAKPAGYVAWEDAV